MTGGITHYNRPNCDNPEVVGELPCHPALVELTMQDGSKELLCDLHGAERIFFDRDQIVKTGLIDEEGGIIFWWKDRIEAQGPDFDRTFKYLKCAYVDHGCCTSGPQESTYDDARAERISHLQR